MNLKLRLLLSIVSAFIALSIISNCKQRNQTSSDNKALAYNYVREDESISVRYYWFENGSYYEGVCGSGNERPSKTFCKTDVVSISESEVENLMKRDSTTLPDKAHDENRANMLAIRNSRAVKTRI